MGSLLALDIELGEASTCCWPHVWQRRDDCSQPESPTTQEESAPECLRQSDCRKPARSSRDWADRCRVQHSDQGCLLVDCQHLVPLGYRSAECRRLRWRTCKCRVEIPCCLARCRRKGHSCTQAEGAPPARSSQSGEHQLQ